MSECFHENEIEFYLFIDFLKAISKSFGEWTEVDDKYLMRRAASGRNESHELQYVDENLKF